MRDFKASTSEKNFPGESTQCQSWLISTSINHCQRLSYSQIFLCFAHFYTPVLRRMQIKSVAASGLNDYLQQKQS
jgi:hypothetical protein